MNRFFIFCIIVMLPGCRPLSWLSKRFSRDKSNNESVLRKILLSPQLQDSEDGRSCLEDRILQDLEEIDSEILSIDARSLYEIMQHTPELTIVDVRPYDDYVNCRIRGAINIPLKDLKFETQEWPRGNKIVIYSTNDRCVLSRRAARRLVQDGFSKVFILENGLEAWSKWPALCHGVGYDEQGISGAKSE